MVLALLTIGPSLIALRGIAKETSRMASATRSFGKLSFRRHGAYHLKSKAESIASGLRRRKRKLARVVPGKSRGRKVWVVYTRGK